MTKDDDVYLRHILDAIDRIGSYTKGKTAGDFKKTKMLQDAVIRQIEIIGEAAKMVSAAAKAKSESVPWKDIAGMRDKLIHGYFGVDLDAVWNTVEKDLPALKKEIENLLKSIVSSR
jgi:uncharacterized protein with HEPN domain